MKAIELSNKLQSFFKDNPKWKDAEVSVYCAYKEDFLVLESKKDRLFIFIGARR